MYFSGIVFAMQVHGSFAVLSLRYIVFVQYFVKYCIRMVYQHRTLQIYYRMVVAYVATILLRYYHTMVLVMAKLATAVLYQF